MDSFGWVMMDWTDALAQFRHVSIEGRIAPFSKDDIQEFLDDPHVFSLSLNRSSTHLALYGMCHTQHRQQFFNGLSTPMRCWIVQQKIQAAELADWLCACMGVSLSTLTDATDIGKGRSIYKLTFQNERVMVLKEKHNHMQQQFNGWANQYKWPVGCSYFHTQPTKIWELSTYLAQSDGGNYSTEKVIGMHAKAAALGDVIGLGDRHFENYMLHNGQLVAIDVSYLMDKNNNEWTKKYIAGGLYELCILQDYLTHPTQFEAALRLFFLVYRQQVHDLFDHPTLLNDVPLAWHTPEQCVAYAIQHHLSSLQVMIERLPYKRRLAHLVESGVGLEGMPDLTMYYYADHHRRSTFFRCDELATNIMADLDALAAKRGMGDVGQDEWGAYHRVIDQFCCCELTASL